MKMEYFWPVYGGEDEVCFPFVPSRDADNIRKALGAAHDAGAVLLTDGSAAYHGYAKRVGISLAVCWSHCRRNVFVAHTDELEGVEPALKQIAALYQVEGKRPVSAALRG
jgi:transposase